MDRIVRICELLNTAYGIQEFSPHNPPLDELVLTILSQNTTAANCHQAFASLRERFPTWDDVRIADEGEIARAIHSGGLSRIKSVRIKNILQEIHKTQGNLDLSWFEKTESKTISSYLLRFDGIGPKTAACVMLFSLGRPVLPVDTHIFRVSKRLGLIGARISAEKAHEMLQAIVPNELIYSFHINMVLHGRQVCNSRMPLCGICILKEECDYFAQLRA